MDFLRRLYDTFFGLDAVVSPLYLLACIPIAYLVYRLRREQTGFFAWLTPRAIWTHKSTRLDLILFVMGRLMGALGIVARFTATPIVAAWVAGLLPFEPVAGGDLSPVTIAFLFWLLGDFATYWVHRIHHQTKTLWPLHAVHHSAEVLTPFTAYRQHPLGILVTVAMQSVLMGAILGILVGAFSPDLTFAEIAGVNAFTFAAILAMANFHHAHIWISYGPILERILISPAQHHIHHSTKPAHFNKNFGGSLAIWDWMFGTLYLTGREEQITFGLSGKDDAPLMTYRLGKVILDPLRRMIFPAR